MTGGFIDKAGWARRDLNPHNPIPDLAGRDTFPQVAAHFYLTDGDRCDPLRAMVSHPAAPPTRPRGALFTYFPVQQLATVIRVDIYVL
jgi:hypothetical protein